MNLNHLKAFIQVVQTNSFKEAARKLGVSQPAITLRIQALEDHFGTKLLTRETDRVQLTTAGEKVLEASLDILKRWTQLEQAVSGTSISGKMKLGASTIPSEYLLPQLIKAYREHQPNVQISATVAGTHEVIKWLTNRTVDATITGKTEEHPDISSALIYTDTLQIIAPLDFNMPNEELSLDRLLTYDWVVREPDSNTRRVWEQELQKRQLPTELKIVGQFGSNEAIIGAVEAGIGLSIISSLAAKRAVSYGRVKVITVADLLIERPFYLSSLKENSPNSLISDFLSFTTLFFNNHS